MKTTISIIEKLYFVNGKNILLGVFIRMLGVC